MRRALTVPDHAASWLPVGRQSVVWLISCRIVASQSCFPTARGSGEDVMEKTGWPAPPAGRSLPETPSRENTGMTALPDEY